MLDAIGEEGAVREIRDRVVERLVSELLLEELALADVAPVQDDAADVLVAEQLGALNLELQLPAVVVFQRTLERVCLGAGGCNQRRKPLAVAWREQPVEQTSL